MRYDLYQIKAATKGKAAKDAKVAMLIDFMDHKIGGLAGDAFERGLYTRVATLDVENWDEAFEVGNIGPEEKITRWNAMASVSVGDILIDEEGQIAVVANNGFIAIKYNAEMAA